MDLDLTPYFEKYEELARAADAVFDRVKSQHPDCVRCEAECADCCHALFDLTLIEALYLNHRFNERFDGKERERLLQGANKADRIVAKRKREAYRSVQEGEEETAVLEALGRDRVRCPLLNDQNLCDLYDHRPITCRLYGIPASVGGKGRSCSLSGFEAGEAYPTVNIDAIHTRLQELSATLLKDLKAANVKLADLLVPLSMALLTDYDDAYFGIPTDDGSKKGKE